METIIKDKKLSIKQIMFKCLRIIFRILGFVIDILADSRNKKYEPTMKERMCGEKIFSSGKYYIPDDKPKH